MVRDIPSCPIRPISINPPPRRYDIQVITPIFGGGINVGENDPVKKTLIRPSSIRGHLRFWWRATRGMNCATVADLRQREGEIWGTMENPSQVGLQVEIKSLGKTYPCAHFPMGGSSPRFEKNHPPYALFPFQGNKRDGISPSECTSNVSFELRLTYPAGISLDVDAAVWAWTNFGGIGARTRRGCGALYCKELSPPEPDASEIKSWYESCLEGFGIAPSTRNWPTLPNSLLVQSSSNAMQAWTDVVGLMQTFRQGEKVGRDLGKAQNHPGRSRWPEAESVRNIVKVQKGLAARPVYWHSPDSRMPDLAFPRAEYGMPIIFEIRNEGLKPTLQHTEDHDRMASPLILRPMRFGNGSFASMIIRLSTSPLKSAYLKPGKSDLVVGYPISVSEISDPKRSAFSDSPRHKFCPGGCSALDAFLSFARTRGFVKVI
jgi:CRISPR-associated protein Cmr1